MHRRNLHCSSASSNKRLRGYHIKKGLDELGDLDVVTNTKNTITPATTPTSTSKKGKSDNNNNAKLTTNKSKNIESSSTTHSIKAANVENKRKKVTSSIISSNKRQRCEESTKIFTTRDNMLASENNNNLPHKESEKVIKSDLQMTTTAKPSELSNSVEYHLEYEQEQEEEQQKECQESEVYKSVFGKDWSEWRKVKELLFNISVLPLEKEEALRVIRVWHARARKDRVLPAYVESTELLMEVVLQDEQMHLNRYNKENQINTNKSETIKGNNVFLPFSANLLRLLYGAALSRVVHIMTGSFASEVHGQTYRARARKIHLPEEIVEVRQRVAHGAMPSLSELRWVCGLTLQYLYHHYWVVQEEHIREMEQQDICISTRRGTQKREQKLLNGQKRNTEREEEVQELLALNLFDKIKKKEIELKKDDKNELQVSLNDIKQFLSELSTSSSEEEQEEEEEEELQNNKEVTTITTLTSMQQPIELQKKDNEQLCEEQHSSLQVEINESIDSGNSRPKSTISGWTISA